MLYGLVLVLHIVICVILIAVILLQAGRGGGLSEAFGGSSAQNFLASRGAEYLTKATTGVAVLFMVTSVSLALLSAKRGTSLMDTVQPTPGVTITTEDGTPIEISPELQTIVDEAAADINAEVQETAVEVTENAGMLADDFTAEIETQTEAAVDAATEAATEAGLKTE